MALIITQGWPGVKAKESPAEAGNRPGRGSRSLPPVFGRPGKPVSGGTALLYYYIDTGLYI